MSWISTAVHALVNIEPLLDVVALMALLRAGLSRRFPAMTIYLAFRCLTEGFLYFILKERLFLNISSRTQTLTYIYSYWILYIIGAFLIFFVLQEIFKAVMEPVPGLRRLGLIAFRWVSIIAGVLVLMNTHSPNMHVWADAYLAGISVQIVRGLSVLEICLMVFLALSVHSLGRSFRGRVFGIGVGFGLEACGGLINTLMYSKPGPIWSLANLFLMSASVITLVIWTVYFALPEPAEERGPITLPVTSPLVRWNDIASALGQRPAHVALGTASSSFFLQDVEQVVDKFLTKTS